MATRATLASYPPAFNAAGLVALVGASRLTPRCVRGRPEGALSAVARRSRHSPAQSRVAQSTTKEAASVENTMLHENPGSYVWIGNGLEYQGGCKLHNPDYDFNDRILAHRSKLAESGLRRKWDTY
jgi:hypothetical protein